jgi:putative sigma-54 modulation protein
MRIHIQSSGFELTEGIREHVLRRVRFSTSHIADHIRRITIHLSDINGPRGGLDKRCRLSVTMEKLAEVVVEDTESDLYLAIDRATDRAARTVTRNIDRARSHRKSGAMTQEIPPAYVVE